VPPHATVLSAGTANPFHPTDPHLNFEEDALMHRDHPASEMAFIKVLLAATVIMGDAVASSACELMGDVPNEPGLALLEEWIESTKIVVGKLTNTVSSFLEPSTPTPYGSLIMRPAVNKETIAVRYKAITKGMLPSVPEFVKPHSHVTHCSHCKTVFSGLNTVTTASIEAFVATSSHVLKRNILRQCPKQPAARCYKSLVTSSLYTDYQLKETAPLLQ